MIAYTGNVYEWNSHEEAQEIYAAETGIIGKAAEELSYRLEDTDPAASKFLGELTKAALDEAYITDEMWEDVVQFDNDASDQELINAILERHSDMRMMLIDGDREFLHRIRQELTLMDR